MYVKSMGGMDLCLGCEIYRNGSGQSVSQSSTTGLGTIGIRFLPQIIIDQRLSCG